MRKLLLLIVACLLGCGGPPERVTIKAVLISVDKDYATTTVEFPDGTRRKNPGLWGEVGDTFMAAKEYGRPVAS